MKRISPMLLVWVPFGLGSGDGGAGMALAYHLLIILVAFMMLGKLLVRRDRGGPPDGCDHQAQHHRKRREMK